MLKADVLSQVSHAFVPEGTQMVSRDLGQGGRITQATQGSILLSGALMLQDALAFNVSDLPDTLDASHATRIRGHVNAFFDAMKQVVNNQSIINTIESQRSDCLMKISQLLPAN